MRCRAGLTAMLFLLAACSSTSGSNSDSSASAAGDGGTGDESQSAAADGGVAQNGNGSDASPIADGGGASGMYGAYALFPKDTSILSTANIDGAFLGFPWKSLQPTSAAPDFSAIDTWLDAAVAANSHVTIGIEAGSATPMWVYGTPADSSLYLSLTEYAFQQQVCQPGQIVPIPWKPAFLSAFGALIDAFAAHVATKPSWMGVIAGMKLTGINNSTFETSLPYTPAQTHGSCVTTDAPTAWKNVGYTDALVNSAWESILPHFDSGFPGKALIIDWIDLGFPAEYVGDTLQPKNNAVSTLLIDTAKTMLGTDRFVVEGTGLSASGGNAPNIDNYAAAGGTVGYQELYYVAGAPAPCVMSAGTGVCDENTLHTALTFGIAHNMRYVELYGEDIAAYPSEVAFAHTSLPPR
jgi:hypothetical protein